MGLRNSLVLASILWVSIQRMALPEQTDDSVTFNRDVAPLLQQHCQDCHRPGQAAPMSLLTYAEVRPWAKAIQQNVTSRTMPPFHAAGPVGRYVEDLRLTDEQIASIARWVESGAPQGDPKDLPEPRTWNDDTWTGGEPDLVVTMPRVEIRSDAIDDNIDLYSAFVFPEDLWLSGIEVRPSNRRALHHANVFLTTENESVPDSLMIREMKSDLLARPFLLQWLPGRSFEAMPKGQAIRIFAGRRIMLNAHYAPSTERQIEETRIGLYFADVDIDVVQKTMGLLSYGALKPIQPNDGNYRYTFTDTFDSDALVADFHFHMHYRGSSATVVFKRPDGTVISGIEVPRYDFNWQRKYTLAEPIALPKGSVAVVELHWDNTASNPLNPDPSQTVKFGRLTTNEMGSTSIGYYDAESKLASPITVRNGRRVDTPKATPKN